MHTGRCRNIERATAPFPTPVMQRSWTFTRVRGYPQGAAVCIDVRLSLLHLHLSNHQCSSMPSTLKSIHGADVAHKALIRFYNRLACVHSVRQLWRLVVKMRLNAVGVPMPEGLSWVDALASLPRVSEAPVPSTSLACGCQERKSNCSTMQHDVRLARNGSLFAGIPSARVPVSIRV